MSVFGTLFPSALGTLFPAPRRPNPEGLMRPFNPNFVSHKRVEAYPLDHLEQPGDGRLIAFVDVGGTLRDVVLPADIAARGAPQPGSMLVRYEPDERNPEGYLTFSPRRAFDEGYTPLLGGARHAEAEVGILFGQLRAVLERSGSSRALSTALTHLDTARMWAREHQAA